MASAYRRTRDGDTWHFCSNCSNWPTTDFVEQRLPPSTGKCATSAHVSGVKESAINRLLKKTQRRGARKIDERRRTQQYVAARRLSATKPMSLFQQPANKLFSSNLLDTVRFNGLKLKRRLIPGEIENVDEIAIVHALFKSQLVKTF